MSEPGLPVPIEEQEDTSMRNIHRLFFKPKTFFEGIAAPKKKAWLLIFALSFGLALAISRTAMNASRGQADAKTWGEYWIWIGIGGFLSALLAYYVGGWFYGLRLRWCGVPQKDRSLVRLVYLGASQVAAIPMIVSALVSTALFADPTAAALGKPAWVGWLTLLVGIWSYVVSYVGARTVFKAPKLRAALLFVGLPTTLTLCVLALGLLLTSIGASLAPRAEISRPLEFSGFDMAFSYPGNWRVTESGPSEDVKAEVQVEGRGGAILNLRRVDSWIEAGNADDLAALMDDWIDGVSESLSNMTTPEPFGEWGTLKGVGRRYEARVKNIVSVPCETRLFVAPITGSEILMIIESLPKAAKEEVGPGFELIRKTFRITS